MSLQRPPLRIFYLEDNPLLVFHIQALIEDLGHVFAGSANSFAELKEGIVDFDMHGALVDIDLADGCTGPAAAAWLCARDIPSIFVTGQAPLAAKFAHLAIGTIIKPVSATELAEKIERFRPRTA